MKLSKKLVSILCAVALLVSALPAAAANNKATDSGYDIDTPYECPIQPGTDEWFAIPTHGERAAACQIPEDMLSRMTTDALVQSVVEYPFFTDILLFSSAEEGYQVVRDHYNGLQELERRENGLNALYQYYTDTKMTRSAETVGILVQAAMEVTMLEGNFLPVLRSRAAQIDTRNFARAFEIYPALSEKIQNRANLVYPKTPNGNDVTHSECEYDRTELSATMIAACEEEMRNNYGLSPERPATNKYNCHSYAWHSQSSSNKWWIHHPDDYLADDYYSKSSNIKVGNKVVYQETSGGEYMHSGIVIYAGSGVGLNIGVRSKWGAAGLYSHNVYNCPSSYGEITTFYAHYTD